MDSFLALMGGFETALQPEYLFLAMVGVFVGTAVGVLPGIGPAMSIALLLPLMNTLDATGAIIMFAGIYYGAMYGGSTTSILLNTPGESASIITALEGNRMAKAGRGTAALATAAIGSFVAGTVATVALTFLAPLAAEWAVKLGPVDYVALMILAFLTVGALLGSSISRGLASLSMGMFIGLIGVDLISGQQRFTFGASVLGDGIDVVLVAVGLFAVGEALYVGSRLRKGPIEVVPIAKGWRNWMTREELRFSWKPWLRGTAIGFPIGTIPAGGADVSTFLSYAAEKKLAKGERKEQFGHGAIEGVAGPESANNAAAAGVLVPLLTLGLPTSATAAIMLVVFQRYDIQPGSQLFAGDAVLVWGLIASLYIGNVMLLVLNLPLVGMWVRVLQIPRHYLYAGILTFAAMGAFAVNFIPADVMILLVIGVIGFLMRRYGYPVGPMVVAMVLGPMFEAQMRRGLSISQGDPLTLVQSPFAVFVYASLVVVFTVSLWLKRREQEAEEVLEHLEDQEELGSMDERSERS